MAVQPRFLIFFRFLCLDTSMNIQLFCFSSESVQLFFLRDLNQKQFKILLWFPNHLLHIGHSNIKFSYIYTIVMPKSSLWKTSRWNARLIYTFEKNSNKKIIKQDIITKSFQKFLLRKTSFNFLKFCWFKQSINTLKFKASASAFYWFQICKKIAWQFKILAILYFYRFIIIVNLTLQQVLLVIEWKEVINFY